VIVKENAVIVRIIQNIALIVGLIKVLNARTVVSICGLNSRKDTKFLVVVVSSKKVPPNSS
jgi:hypothetical protein